jgi:hypothetical protein
LIVVDDGLLVKTSSSDLEDPLPAYHCGVDTATKMLSLLVAGGCPTDKCRLILKKNLNLI